ncbi:MAG: 30S ribosome-binding factor RbfA [Gemmatimonadales bacterium]
MRGASRRRPEQVAEVIRQVVAEAIAREVRDPRVGFLTITRVDVSGDLGHAVIHVSRPGEDEDRRRALLGLRSASGFLRSRVAKALATRTVPELHFELDRGLEHAARIDAMLAELKREEEAGD